MRFRAWLAPVAIVLAVGTTLTAQGTARRIVPQMSGLKFVAPWRPLTAKGASTKIVGTVVDIRQIPVHKVKVRVRSLDNGGVLAEVDTNENGEYAFDTIEPGTYVVEMVMHDGRVVALSNAGSLARNETLNTVVQLPGRWDSAAQNVTVPNNYTGFVGVSAETSMTATTVTIAGTTNVPPADPGEPVSP